MTRDNDTRPIDRREFIRLGGVLLTGGSAAFLGGCGGNDGSGPRGQGKGRAVVTVSWPPKQTAGRLIPFASNSILVRITAGDAFLGDALLVRPSGGGEANATFDRLPVGDATVTATAFPNADGTGVAQAMAHIGVTIVAGQITPIHLTMGSTIDHLEVAPAAPNITVGQTAALTATAKDAAGNTILISPSRLRWSTSDANIATVDVAGSVAALAAGTATVTVTELESSKSGSATVTIAATGIGDDFNDNQINADLWQVATAGTGATVTEVNQRLEVTVRASATGADLLGAGYRTRCLLHGDFDVQVDYQLLTWPSTNGIRMGIWLGDVSNPHHAASTHRVSLNPFEFGNDPRESHTGTYNFDQAYVRVATTATSGKLRLIRSGETFSSSYWNADASQWVLLLSGGNNASDLPVTLFVWSSDNEFQHVEVKAAFDNFVLNQGEFVCP